MKNRERLSEDHYTKEEVETLIPDMEMLHKYLNGIDDAIINGYWYRRRYVNAYMRR